MESRASQTGSESYLSQRHSIEDLQAIIRKCIAARKEGTVLKKFDLSLLERLSLISTETIAFRGEPTPWTMIHWSDGSFLATYFDSQNYPAYWCTGEKKTPTHYTDNLIRKSL